MKKVYIDEKSISDYRDFIPSDFDEILFSENVVKIGMEFSGMPSGAIICKFTDDGKPAKLLSVYVLPEARRLGVGSSLIFAALKELADHGIERLAVKYTADGDRASLLEFLSSVGFEADSYETPIGSVTLSEASEKIGKVFAGAEEQGKAISELSNAEKNVFVKVLGKTADIYSKDYLGRKPESFVIMRDNYIKSVLAFSGESEDRLNLDYAYSADPREFAMLLKYALRKLGADYPGDTVIEMLLVNENSRELYERIFGKSEGSVSIVEGSLSF